jgi:hypothetical protein
MNQKRSSTTIGQPVPELPVADVEKAQQYYRDVLGFEIGWLDPGKRSAPSHAERRSSSSEGGKNRLSLRFIGYSRQISTPHMRSCDHPARRLWSRWRKSRGVCGSSRPRTWTETASTFTATERCIVRSLPSAQWTIASWTGVNLFTRRRGGAETRRTPFALRVSAAPREKLSI